MMTELSLNILDVAQNSIKAGAKLIEISVEIDNAADSLTVRIDDDGCGMSGEQLAKVTDPFFTTRGTRSVGLGVSFFKQAAEMTGGGFEITSESGKGTKVKATFVLSSIDRLPLGDMCSTVETLIVYNTGIDFVYRYRVDETEFTLSTAQMRDILGGVSLDAPDVVEYVRGFLKENTDECDKGKIY
ncbi:MAG: ATP-binding protein [Oscillospiraceae bacterium]|jgi:anti-sigma regulatory factor (Ser/Thr protein kinase)|nr:ATP-binding protein [Oscillospiraceae bacterium]